MAHPRHRIALTALLAGWLAAAPAQACGPWGIGVLFWPAREPGPAREAFLRGELGILAREQDAAYHFVAYRYLAAIGGAADAEALGSLWEPAAPVAEEDALGRWCRARARVPGAEPLGWFSTSRHETVERGDTVLFLYFRNCLDDAFATAAETLEARIGRFGAASPEVRAWLDAQDRVFANCAEGESIPPPLDEGSDPLLRADREYQIAAAYFYATRYGEAAERFRRISRDPDSPWRDLSAYLVGRALIRDGRYAAASEELRNLLADPRRAAMHGPAQRLLAFSDLRGDPQAKARELEGRLLAPALEAPLAGAFTDFLWLVDRGHGHGNGLGAWLRTMGGRGASEEVPSAVATARWSESLRWLVAALAAAAPDFPGLEELLAAAAALPEGSPAHLTASFHRARLLAAAGRDAEARAVLDPLLEAADGLSAGDRNRLRLLRAEVTPDLDAYLRLAAVVPVGLGWDDGGRQLLPMGEGGPALPYYSAGDAVLPDAAVELLNHGLTTEEMLQTASGESLPDPWRRRLALATWTRAVVTGNDAVAVATAPLVSALAPELADEMSAFTAAQGDDRRFEAAWTLLRFPGLAPVVRWNVGRQTPIDEVDPLRDNGWCAGVLDTEGVPGQRVRSREQVAAVRAALPAELAPWPEHAGRVVLSRAATHPGEPRLAEALHRVVRATRIGCPAGSYGEVSKAAFRLLHRRFPDSPWAKQTPHWFD